MTALFEDNWIQQVMHGLAQEYGKDFDYDFVQQQLKFIPSINWMTNWSKEIAVKRIPLLREMRIRSQSYRVSVPEKYSFL